MSFSSLAVFCGSKAGTDPLYTEHAKQLGHLLSQKNIILIYGGGGKGLMGTVADAVMEGGGKVIGVIPEILLEWEAQHKGITELHVVPDMHVRKRKMYELCDAAVILPGGNGTLDEMFEMLTWNTLNIHDKKIFLLNTNGFYNHLIAHLHHMYKENFLYESPDHRIAVINSPEEIF
ncbi:MAG: TIGR00730 family Rossman fold protein [Chitinophagaceae bacterium]|nr:TIGR00730 family Rossman fold protein [Chitinophagaceae bacterium]